MVVIVLSNYLMLWGNTFRFYLDLVLLAFNAFYAFSRKSYVRREPQLYETSLLFGKLVESIKNSSLFLDDNIYRGGAVDVR
jgi:hypothetical protein